MGTAHTRTCVCSMFVRVCLCFINFILVSPHIYLKCLVSCLNLIEVVCVIGIECTSSAAAVRHGVKLSDS